MAHVQTFVDNVREALVENPQPALADASELESNSSRLALLQDSDDESSSEDSAPSQHNATQRSKKITLFRKVTPKCVLLSMLGPASQL